MSETIHHQIVIVGGGTAGITVAAQLTRGWFHHRDVAVVEPSDKHYYQPLWTLVEAGLAGKEATERAEASIIPRGVTWLREAVTEFLPEQNMFRTRDGKTVAHDWLVAAAGLQINWDKIPGLKEAIDKDGVCSNYSYATVDSTSLIGTRPMPRLAKLILVLMLAVLALPVASGQDKSVKPGINDTFRDPDPQEFRGKFEVESREVFARRQKIVAACEIQPGQTVADIGAGTGLFTRMFAESVGKEGQVFAADISQKFLDHILATSREAGQQNVETVLCKADSTELPPRSIDVAFICDTYHHFEFPLKTMASLHRALKPGGRVILVDFRRVEGTSTDWVMNHVRAGQDVFEAEVVQAGFQKVHEERELLKENYFVVFEKVLTPQLVSPIIPMQGGVLPRPKAVEQPRAGAKVIFDATADAKPTDVNKGFDRVARLLNLYGVAGLKAQDVKITIVLHGEATKSVLNDAAYKARFQVEANPNLPLIRELQKAGVEVLVCGQALNYKGFPDDEVADGIPIAAAALTVVINKQTDGYSYVPVP